MKVIFLKDVAGVAKAGQVKDVSDGYVRNFLLPKKLAQKATPALIQRVEAQKKKQEREHAQTEAQAEQRKKQLQGKTFTIKAKASAEGKLYGGIGAQAIADTMKRAGAAVDASHVELQHSLKDVGDHSVNIKLGFGFVATVHINIQPE